MAGFLQKRVLATLRCRNSPLIIRGFASDALGTAEIKPGEVGIVSGIPEQHLRRRVKDPHTPLLRRALAGINRISLEGLRWRVFDCKGQVLGRLASQISVVLQGKDKPTYAPNRDDGDMCIVINAKDICVTGKKLTDKVYRWHTGYIGHLKERTLKDQMAKDPTEVIRKAVFRMLPKNKLQDDRDRKLRIFAGGEHPFADRPLESLLVHLVK